LAPKEEDLWGGRGWVWVNQTINYVSERKGHYPAVGKGEKIGRGAKKRGRGGEARDRGAG